MILSRSGNAPFRLVVPSSPLMFTDSANSFRRSVDYPNAPGDLTFPHSCESFDQACDAASDIIDSSSGRLDTCLAIPDTATAQIRIDLSKYARDIRCSMRWRRTSWSELVGWPQGLTGDEWSKGCAH